MDASGAEAASSTPSLLGSIWAVAESAGTDRYIDGFYNPTRRHSLLGYVSALAYERQEGAVAA